MTAIALPTTTVSRSPAARDAPTGVGRARLARLAHWARRARVVGATALLAAVMALAPACSTSPATGRTQFNVLSEDEEISIGEQAAPEFLEEYGGELPDENVVQYVRDIGHELAALSERPDLPWEFNVVDSATINAFVLPGGKVFITRGMLAMMENEAQLAGVLGHEIGHVTDRHIGQQMARRLGVSLGLFAIGVAAQHSEEDWLTALGVGAQLGGTFYLLSFSRQQENAADELGIRYMTAAGYNPRGQLEVMQILAQLSDQRGFLVELFSTHPEPNRRIERIQGIIDREYPDAYEPGAYEFGRERFQSTVTAALERLPPPRHTPQPQPEPTAQR